MTSRNYFPSREELRQIREGKVPGAPDKYFGALEYKAKLGQMSLEQANNLFENNRISLPQRNALWSLIDKTDRPDMSAARDFVRNAFVPNPLDPTTRAGNVRKAEVDNQLILAEAEARAAGKPFDALGTARELVNKRQEAEDMKNLQADRDRLRQKLSEIGLDYNEDYTLESLKRSGKGNATQHKTIDRLIKSINANK